METFQDFKQSNGPERSAGSIIAHAFDIYKGIFLYAIGALLLMFLISFLIQPISGFRSEELLEEIQNSPETVSENMWSIPGIRTYYGLSGLISLLLAPIYVGIIYIANKYNLNERLDFSDIFIGYKQNFLNIVLYSLVSSIILAVSFAMCFVPGLFVLPFLMLGYPILLFENATFSDALKKSFNLAKENYGVFLGTALLGFLVSICGVFLCGIGIIFTMPIFLVVMYSLYVAYCGRPRPIITKD